MPAVKLSPLFNGQTVTASGAPASGYKLYTYAAGSSTQLATYVDATGSTPQANPIVLNANGYPANPIWLQAGLSYKFVLKDANDVAVGSPWDNVAGINDTTTTLTQWQSSGATPTYVSATSFTLSGDQTSEFHVGRRVQATVTVGTVYGVIISSAYSSLTTVTMLMDSGQALDSGLSVVNLSILRNDKLALPLIAGRLLNVQVFTANGTYTPTPGMQSAIVEVQGGGGAGGGAYSASSGLCSVAAGGYSGAYAKSRLTAAQIGASQTVTVGAGGTGATAANGGNGGTSSFGALLSAAGGAGGSAFSSQTPPLVNVQTPSVVTASGGNIVNQTGAMGAPGLASGALYGGSGNGAASVFGGGAATAGLTATPVNGVAATSKGAGGSGAACGAGSGSGAAGGNGAPGVVIVWEYA